MTENTPEINKIYNNSAQLISLYTKNAVKPINTQKVIKIVDTQPRVQIPPFIRQSKKIVEKEVIPNLNSIHIKNTTLVCIDCIDVKRAIQSIENCIKVASFENVKLLTSLPTDYKYAVKIDNIDSIHKYSKFCIKELYKYIDTDFVLIVQHDGWIVNKDAWNDDWYNYDYIGGNSRWTGKGPNGLGGNGGFSFRSKKLLKYTSELLPNEDGIINEDINICVYNIKKFQDAGFKFATREIQNSFSIDEGKWSGSFGHHKSKFYPGDDFKSNHMIRISIDSVNNNCHIYSEKNNTAGFYCHVNYYIFEINKMVVNDLRIKLSFDKSWDMYCDNGTELYNNMFKQNDDKIKYLIDNYSNKNVWLGNENAHFRYNNLKLGNSIINAYFEDSDKIVNKSNEFITSNNINPEETIAIYYRSGDKINELTAPKLEDYIKLTKILLNKNNNFKIIFQSDSLSATETFKKEFLNCIVNTELQRTDQKNGIHFITDKEKLKNDIFIFHSMVSIMSKCKYLICNCSNISAFMSLKRGYNDGIIQFEQNGELNMNNIQIMDGEIPLEFIDNNCEYEFGIIKNGKHHKYTNFKLLKNGIITGNTHSNESFWEYKSGYLFIYNEDKSRTTNFNIFKDNIIIGDFLYGGKHYLKKLNEIKNTSKSIIVNSDIKHDVYYEFSNDNSTLHYFKLNENGTIQEPPHYNETYWNIENGKLMILNGNKEVTTTFTHKDENGRYIGKFMSGHNHYLKENNDITEEYLNPINTKLDDTKNYNMKSLNIKQRHQDMHKSQYDTIKILSIKYFKKFDETVYDIGSYDVNGSHKDIFYNLNLKYLGVDIINGPNVDIVVSPYNWDPINDNSCQYIISGSCLEHVEAPWLWAKELYKKTKMNGIIIILLPYSLGEHKYPVDCYRILPDGLKYLFGTWAGFNCLECGFTKNNNDTYFVGEKII